MGGQGERSRIVAAHAHSNDLHQETIDPPVSTTYRHEIYADVGPARTRTRDLILHHLVYLCSFAVDLDQSHLYIPNISAFSHHLIRRLVIFLRVSLLE